MSIVANLYPPLVPDSQAAFITTKPCRIYFALSIYNSFFDIKNVQVSLINQKTNSSAFDIQKYPFGIKIAELKEDYLIDNDYKYYVEISSQDLPNQKTFDLNTFYKVQLRFTSNDVGSDEEGTAAWFSNNLDYFSQWSTVCLIKGIAQPKIYIHNLSQDTFVTLPTSVIDIVGNMSFDDKNEKEYLRSYRFFLYYGTQLLEDSGELYTNHFNPNQFNYELGYELTTGLKYTLKFIFTTINGYSEEKIYNFSVIEPEIRKLNVTIDAIPDNENGRIKVTVKALNSQRFNGNLTIRRTSSESDFHKWEDVKNFIFKNRVPIDIIWYDYTPESGIWYKYCVQQRKSTGDRGIITATNQPVMCEFDDIFLVKNGCQLKIQFNPTISSFKYNVTESQQTTLGGKFPFIKRNGNNYYRTFPIGGLICSFMDTSGWYDPHFYDGKFHPEENETKIFTSKEQIYGNYKNIYDEYNKVNNISDYQDRIYERKFREQVYKFLYDNSATLFKSTTEGNILVKIMDIDFQPDASLGRRLYSFTANAVEIDEGTISNYDYYKIQPIGELSKEKTSYQSEFLGQIFGTIGVNELIENTLNQKYQHNAPQGYIANVEYLKWLRIEVFSDPYVIIEKNGQPIKATSQDNIDPNKSISGYIVEINGKKTIIKNSMIRRASNATDLTNEGVREIESVGILELSSPDTQITSLKFNNLEDVVIDYIAVVSYFYAAPQIQRIERFYKWGQLYKNFEPEDSIIEEIYNKYSINCPSYKDELTSLQRIKIEAPAGTVVYIKDSRDKGFDRHVLENGYLDFQEDSVFIEGIYFFGVHLKQHKTEDPSIVRDNQYLFVPDSYDFIEDIQNPVDKGVYQIPFFVVKQAFALEENTLIGTSNTIQTISNTNTNYALLLEKIKNDSSNKAIYYHGQWCPITPQGDVLIAIDGIVNYFGSITRTVYYT